ncbi:MAG TPA: GGDEF domain-containing protein [Syntrophales bacterium]|nr:GGDEF domain-containing protein [Syntrophales bacterium]
MTALFVDKIPREDLERIRLFRYVNLDSIMGLLESCSLRTLQEGEILIQPGRTNAEVYLILSGKVRIHLETMDSDPITVLGVGESVGEMSVLDGKQTSAYAVANEICQLLVMDEDILWSLVHSSHAAACNLLLILTCRLRNTDHVMARNSRLDEVYQLYGSVDALTGIHNRHWIDNALDRLCTRCDKGGIPLTVFMIDIDHFKSLNDHYGHLYGDRILHSVARLLSGHLRPSEPIGRYGGDEFVIVVPHIDESEADWIAERLCQSMREAPPLTLEGRELPHPTISVGVATKKTGQTARELLEGADQALYRAKSKGRDQASR